MSQRRTLAPTSPSRRPRGGRPGRRTWRAAARARACGRCPRGRGRSRGRRVRNSRSPGRMRRAPSARRPRRSRAAPVEARHVLAVAVDLVGVDEVREHEPLGRARPPAGRSPAIAVGLSGAGCSCRDRRARRTPGPPCRPRGPARPPRRARRGRSAPAARSAKSRRPAVRRNAPGSPSNGRAITRPTACSPASSSRAAGAVRRRARAPRRPRRVRGHLEDRVLRRVDDQLAGPQVALAVLVDRAQALRAARCRSRRARWRRSNASITSAREAVRVVGSARRR